SEDPDWGGPGAILNIGMNAARHQALSDEIGSEAATRLYLKFIQSYSTHVARLDPDIFDDIDPRDEGALEDYLDAYENEAEEPFPQDRDVQLAGVLKSMARAWEGTTARLLRQAKGAPADAGLGLVIQALALGVGNGESGSGVLQLVNSDSGYPQITGRYMSQSQGRDALQTGAEALYLQADDRGASLEEHAPEVFAKLKGHAAVMREKLREEMEMEFTLDDGVIHILDGVRVARTARAAVRIAVSLAQDGIIPQQEAVMRIEPRALNELLHRQVDPEAERDMIGDGIGASPGAATGKIVFTAAEAQASAARGEACILVRRETNPEDIRGMHAANAALTERGGMTSHAAVIARGLGLPCVVGATSLKFQTSKKQLVAQDGRVFHEGDVITVDGTNGQVLAGEPLMMEAALDESFQTLMGWADESRDIGVRANADTPADARTALVFQAEGIGLARTEHMFFEADQLIAMREVIFAEDPEGRSVALQALLPMQREMFVELFEVMGKRPVCIRLFDPPLHEFLPTDRAGLRDLAEALNLPLSDVTLRVEELGEYNPMLGMRGVRLGITVPEILDM
ncbi:MAG: pyruvate, phosphate dikinase, partial [Shimia sp.]|nr:pyruvate, phosphate dikinase [Shimia sp.]